MFSHASDVTLLRLPRVTRLHRRALGRERREADDVAEVDGHGLIALRQHLLASHQVLGNGRRQQLQRNRTRHKSINVLLSN